MVDTPKDVLVEGGGDASGIVVGRQQRGGIFAQVDAGKELIARTHGPSQALQEVNGIGANKVADVGTKPEDETRWATLAFEKVQPVVVFAGDGEDLEITVVLDQGKGTLLEDGARDIDGNKAQLPVAAQQGFDDETGLARRTRTQLDEIDGVVDMRHEFVSMFLEDGPFCPCGVILGQIADLLEQERTRFVVEVQAGEPLSCCRQTDMDIGGDIRALPCVGRRNQCQAVGFGGDFVEVGDLGGPSENV